MPTVPPAYVGVTAGSSRSPRRWPWLVAAVLVVLAVGVAGGYLFTRDDNSADVATDRGNGSSDDDSGRATDAPSQQPDESDSSADNDPETQGTTAPSASASAAPMGAACWDGSEALTVADCPRPQGRAGLEYVFPSMNDRSCTDITTPEQRGIGRKLLIQCFDYLTDGTEIRINYSQWASVSAGSAHYDSQGLTRSEVNAPNGDVLLYQWFGVGVDGEYKVAGLYGQEPFSSSLYAPTSTARDDALATLVSARPVDQVLGQPIN